LFATGNKNDGVGARLPKSPELAIENPYQRVWVIHRDQYLEQKS
jgi:hypothetical protein